MTDRTALDKPASGDTVRGALNRFFLWLGLMLLGAAVIHIVIVFALPSIGRGVLIETVLPPGEAAPQLHTSLAGNDLPRFRFTDARMDSVYCSFDLRDGAVRVSGELDVPFWSISVHTLSGLVVGSVNHNAASGGRLDLVVMRPALARELAETGAQLPQEALVVEMQGPVGVARISGLAPYDALRPGLRAALAQTTCDLATFTFLNPSERDAPLPDQDAPSAPGGPPSVPQPVARPDRSETP